MTRPIPLGNAIDPALDFIESLDSSTAPIASVQSGFAALDDITGGLQAGSLTVVASRQGVGRSTLLREFCRFAAHRNSLPSLLITPMSSHLEMTLDLLASSARVSARRLLSGTMTDQDWERLARVMPDLAAAPLFLTDEFNIPEIEILNGNHNLKVIAFDDPDADVEPGSLHIYKKLAQRFDVALVVGLRLRDEDPDRTRPVPRLSELGAGVTTDADVVILLHREDLYDPESTRVGEADLIVARNKFGPTRRIPVKAELHYRRFVELASERRGPS